MHNEKVTSEEFIKYVKKQTLRNTTAHYEIWAEQEFDYCTYPFKLLYERGICILDNFDLWEKGCPTQIATYETCKEYWEDANKEITRMRTLEDKMQPDQLDMQIALLVEIGALLVRKVAEIESERH